MMSTIGIIIDVIIVAILVVFALLSFKKGFIKSVLSLFSWSACILIAIYTAKYVAGWINNIYDFSSLIGGKITDGLYSTNEFFSLPLNTYSTAEEWIANIPTELNSLLAQLVKVVFSNTAVDLESTTAVGAVVGESLGYICTLIISGILIFIVLKILVTLLSKLFESITKISIFGWLNRLLGLVLGVVKAGFIIIVGNLIVVLLSLVPTVNSTMTSLIQDNTYVEKFIYNKVDDFVGEYVIEGDTIQNWITNLWNSRQS